jgi:hypothetical protein
VGDIALGYGSKWHLLRYLGWHRTALNQKCVGAIPGAEEVDWLDFPFDVKGKPSGDAEWESLDFLGEGGNGVRAKWRQVWPHGRGIQTWDAVGRVRAGSAEEWLLVEAKAHLGEIKSNCGAKDGLALIKTAVDGTKAALGVAPECDWLKGYYQYANRVAALHFLIQHEVPARLLFIYFTGDSHHGCRCPSDEAGWHSALDAQAKHVGLPNGYKLEGHIHRLFLRTAS